MLAVADQPVTFRPVQESDTALLLAVYSSTRTEELAQVPWADGQKENFLQMQFEAQRKYYEVNYPGADFQIILAQGKPAGRLYLHRRAREIRIMDLALLPEFRRRGIGTKILEDILAEAGRTGRAVTVHVECFNPAQRLYDRLGFTRIGSTGVYHLLQWRNS